MLFKEKVIPLALSMVVIFIASLIYHEQNFDIEAEFSQSLRAWFVKGKYFNYNSHKIFYVYENLQQESWSEVKPTIVLLHGFPTSSFDYLRVWNLFMNKNDDLTQRDNRINSNSILAFDYLGFYYFTSNKIQIRLCSSIPK